MDDDFVGAIFGGLFILAIIAGFFVWLWTDILSVAVDNLLFEWRMLDLSYLTVFNVSLTIGAILIIFLLIKFHTSIYSYIKKLIISHNEYVICPYCDKSVLFYYDWTCDYCGNNQGEKRSLEKKCTRCKRKLASFICEHCEKEIMLDAD